MTAIDCSFSKLTAAALAACAVLLCSCNRDSLDMVNVRLTQSSHDVPYGKVRVTAEVIGPTANLQYRWTSDYGECKPEEGPDRSTICEADKHHSNDAITVQVFRDGKLLTSASTLVKLTPAPAADAPPETGEPVLPQRAKRAETPQSKVEIRITQVPLNDPVGGPDTRADIAGTVTGLIGTGYKVVLYAYTDSWWVQPLVNSDTPIDRAGQWRNWTHTGSEYAALVVPVEYEAPPRMYSKPRKGGDIIAATIESGKK